MVNITQRSAPAPAAAGEPGGTGPPGPLGHLGRLAGWCYDHRRRVLAGWILAIVAMTVLGQVVGSHFQTNFSNGQSPSERAQEILSTRFPQQAGTPAYVVVHTTEPLDAAANVGRTARMDAALRRIAHVSRVVGPHDPGAHDQISKDGHLGFSVVQFDEGPSSLPNSAVKEVVTTAQSFAVPGYYVAVGGQVVENVVSAAPGSSEGIGITAAIIIMLIAFGSVVAMGLPILTALFGVAIGFAVEDLVSHLLNVPTFSPELLAMIGLGVGIDYALFIVTRYRQGLAQGLEPRRAVVVSLATSGRAVLFAGTTVIISLCGLFIVDLPFMVGLAVSAIAGVVLVMAGALTLLPALLGFAGRAIDRLHIPGLLVSGAPPGPRSFWSRWSRVVQRHPWTTGGGALLVLVVLAIPLFSMRLAFTDAGNDPTTLTTRQAFDLLAEGFGPGFNGPLLLAAELPPGIQGTATVDRLDADLAHTPGVAYVTPPTINSARDAAVIVVYPTGAPQAAETAALVTRLRGEVIPAATQGTGVRVVVGGQTAAGVDASAYLSGRLFWVIGTVIVVSIVLLMAVFRSIAIPLKAAVMNLLAVGAAYGVVVAVFQWGWADGLFGNGASGPIDPWIPLMMFTILFGLSMDYEVFLLTRIREEWRRTGDNSRAVADGLARTARVITAAAAIMICVFGSFVINDPLRVLAVFGFGLAAAILIDATLVRMVLVPSVMELLGDANWYFPRRLDRIIPTLGVEVDVAELGDPPLAVQHGDPRPSGETPRFPGPG